MISLDECRKLAPALQNVPDEQVRCVRESLYILGRSAVLALLKESGSKYPNRVLTKFQNHRSMNL